MKCRELMLEVSAVKNLRLIYELLVLLEVKINSKIEARLGRKLEKQVELRLDRARCLQQGNMFHLYTEDMTGHVYLGQFESGTDEFGKRTYVEVRSL